MNLKVDFYFQKTKKWKTELELLRSIALNSELTEELKWGCPCYTHQQGKIVLIHTFKDYCAFLFFKGALLKDADGILVQQTKNVQSARQIRFRNAREIEALTDTVKAYIREAVRVEQSGLSVELKQTTEFSVPAEFQEILIEIPELQTAFEALTPGRQRAYLLHFAQPKQAKTRTARVEKHMQDILAGRGLNDR